jgi:hypothetical protein
MAISDRRAMRVMGRQRTLDAIVNGEPSTAQFFSTHVNMSTADLQALLIGAGAPDIAALRDGLFGSTTRTQTKEIGKKLGFTNADSSGRDFGTLPNGKRGARGARVVPPSFVRALIARQPGIGATGADVKAADCARLPANQVRPVLVLLGSDISKTGSPDAALERALKGQAARNNVTVTSYTQVGNDVVICPRATMEALILKAATFANCTAVSAGLLNATLMVLGHRDPGIVDPSDSSKPNDKLTEISKKRFKSEAAKRGCTVTNIVAKPISIGSDPKTALVCPPECVNVISQAAIAVAKKKAEEQAAKDAVPFTKKLSVRDVQKVLMQCSNRARRTLKNDKEVRDGRWGRDTASEFNRVATSNRIGAKKPIVKIVNKEKTRIRISPPALWDKLKRCARDEEAKRKKAAEERKKREDLMKPEDKPMEPEELPITPSDDVVVIPDDPIDPFSPDIPSGDDIGPPIPDDEPIKAGFTPGLGILAGLAGIALVLFAAQRQKK